MSGFTPGPWTHRLSDDEEACNHEIMGAWEGGARRWIGGVESLEDARLIAAAPEVLRELKHLRACLHPWIEAGHRVPGIATLNGADAAIAKATGGQP